MAFSPHHPSQAKPSPELLECLRLLGSDPNNTVVVISGRDYKTLDSWLGHLPIELAAEHGAFERRADSWQQNLVSRDGWKEFIRPILESVVLSLPGSFVEEKETSIVFHYRASRNAELAATKSEQLAEELLSLAQNLELDILHDSMAVEIRQTGADKGKVAQKWLASGGYDFILCAGDGLTDEDMFKVMPEYATTIKIGLGRTGAGYRLESPKQLIKLLDDLIKA